ncbi:hypothetical protein GOV07_00390 [Candidatus Woesearchaeota archaeon]|nr:hypothetical protein [Candidatus Woesearchaeota archaeon]
MGFFGFLKKPAVTAPTQPPAAQPPSEVPPPPTTTPGATPSSAPDKPGEVPPLDVAPSPSLMQHEDDLGFENEIPAEEGTPEIPLNLPSEDTPPSDVPDTPPTPDLPPVSDTPMGGTPANPELPPAPDATEDMMSAPVTEVPHTTTSEEDDGLLIEHSDKRVLAVDLPPMGSQPVEVEPKSWSKEPEEHTLPSMASNDAVPDFTDEEIAAAEELEPHPEVRTEELPGLDPLPELPFETVESLYVPAVAYREALGTISSFQKSVHKGDGALDKFTQQITAHGTELGIFAEKLNMMQEELIQMDNVLNER